MSKMGLSHLPNAIEGSVSDVNKLIEDKVGF